MTLDECPTLLTENLLSYPSLGTFTIPFESFGNILQLKLSLPWCPFLTLTLIVAFISVLTWSTHPPHVTSFPLFCVCCSCNVLSFYFSNQAIKHCLITPGNHC